MQNTEWIFAEKNASGESQGGDLAKKAFTLNLKTFTREVLQNAEDANSNDKIEEETAEVTFKLVELTGENVKAFLNSIEWDNLRQHLELGAYGDYQFMKEEIEKLESTQKLRLLIIEDSNTSGLYGDELEEDSPFKSLVKDKLKSSKDSDSSAGSHGLGKTVLWAFSAFSTVFFFSNIHEKLRGNLDQHRFIGRTAIPSHDPPDEWGYTGSGWFGERRKRENRGYYAHSLFGEKAKEAADNLLLNRENEKSGTSILVFGFREPMLEDRNLKDIINELRHATAESFWPTMVRDTPGLIVNTKIVKDGETIHEDTVDPNVYENLRPYIKAYKDYLQDNCSAEFEDGNETILRNIKMKIPPRKDGEHDSFEDDVKLLIRLADQNGKNSKQVARFRGPGMVIDYLKTGDLALDAQNYHAVLVTGVATGETDKNKFLDKFLKLAEPPEHTKWTSTDKLRNNYKEPYLKPLNDLETDIEDEIRKLVRKDSSSGQEVSPELQKRFRLGTQSGGFIKESEFQVDANATVKSGRWEFNSTVKRKVDVTKPWKVNIYPRFAEVDTPFTSGDLSLLEEIEAHVNGKKIDSISSKKGFIQVKIPKENEEVYIKAITNPENYPIDIDFSSLELRIEGEK